VTPLACLLAAGALVLVLVSPPIIIGIVERLRRREPQKLVWDSIARCWVPVSRKIK